MLSGMFMDDQSGKRRLEADTHIVPREMSRSGTGGKAAFIRREANPIQLRISQSTRNPMCARLASETHK